MVLDYASLLEDDWRERIPDQYAAIPDRRRFFTELARRMEAEIDTISAELAGSPPPGETYWQRVGRLNEATSRAREIVMNDWLPNQTDQT
jgi:hypothetical protein